jgi:hypothetical protein
MSLFGGDGSAPASRSPYESEAELSQPSSTRSSPSIERHADPQDAQSARNLPSTLESDYISEIMTQCESDNANTFERSPTRPNRFKGGQATWKGYTAADRQVAESLEQIQNTDLAAHLYNAHALKRRVRRRPEDLAELKKWQNAEQWLKSGSELNYTDISGETQTSLVPSKDWTAWPLPPAKLPRASERAGREVVEEMRDELLATFLRQAKDRWNTRDIRKEPVRRNNRTIRSRSSSRSKSIRSARSQRSTSRADASMKDDEDDLQTDKLEMQDEDGNKLRHTVGKKRGRAPPPQTFFKPMFLADDERALKTLHPTITSVMSKVDDLALAVRRSRLNHFGRGAYSDTSSQSEFTSAGESSEQSSRRLSRIRTKSRAKSKLNTRPASRATSARPRHASPRSGLNDYNSLSDGDSDFDANTNGVLELPPSRKRGRSGSTADEQSSTGSQEEIWRAGLMDWSEVLGLAAVKGWDERVIARTAQRCATLFGENMSFAAFDESLALKPIPDPVQYKASTIPPPDIISTKTSVHKRPMYWTGTLRCPHVGCYGYDQDFETPYRTVEHCIRVHGYDPRSNDSDNEDRTVGGVHIDGFLQPVAARRGWSGRGASRANSETKRHKVHQADDTSAEDLMLVDSD